MLRGLTYLQTASGPNAGNVVLWMQPDGTLNPSAEPVELPDPSDSDASYWVARTIWALGEGYAAFENVRPRVRELPPRPARAVDRRGRPAGPRPVRRAPRHRRPAGPGVADRQRRRRVGRGRPRALGVRRRRAAPPRPARVAGPAQPRASRSCAAATPATGRWARSVPGPSPARSGTPGAADAPAALADASSCCDDPALAAAAHERLVHLRPVAAHLGRTRTTAGCRPAATRPRSPTAPTRGCSHCSRPPMPPAGTTGAATGLAGIVAAWYFGANPAGEAMYDPATGRTFDGISGSGEVNHNSGAESTIHGLLSMIALDEHPRSPTSPGPTPSPPGRAPLTLEAEDGTLAGDAAARCRPRCGPVSRSSAAPATPRSGPAGRPR